ncbi:MAG: hypothetical protein PHY92_07415 [Alphaproteobacteria bacterium]|nr:hypothetical protein [Alphaproteobacteria bacterium]
MTRPAKPGRGKLSSALAEKITYSFQNAVDNDLVASLLIAEDLTGVSASILGTIGTIESEMKPWAIGRVKAHKGTLQIIDSTYVIYLALHGPDLINKLAPYAPATAARLREILKTIPYDEKGNVYYENLSPTVRANLLDLRNGKKYRKEKYLVEIVFAAKDLAFRMEKAPAKAKKNLFLFRLVHKHTKLKEALAELRGRPSPYFGSMEAAFDERLSIYVACQGGRQAVINGYLQRHHPEIYLGTRRCLQRQEKPQQKPRLPMLAALTSH